MAVTEEAVRRIVAEELSKHRAELTAAASSASAAAVAQANAAAASASAAAASAAAAAVAEAPVQSAGGVGACKAGPLTLELPGGGSSVPPDEGIIVSALYRQFGLVLGEMQAGDSASAVARIRANLRALSVVRDRPEGWSGLSQLVDSYTASGKTEADPLTPSGHVGALDVNMLSAEHASVLYPAAQGSGAPQ